MALVASALVRLPILSVLRLAPQNSSTKCLCSSRRRNLAPTRAYTLKQFEFSRFASPRTLYKMVKNRLLRKPQEPLRHLDSGTYL
jgi:hypothetical protein